MAGKKQALKERIAALGQAAEALKEEVKGSFSFARLDDQALRKRKGSKKEQELLKKAQEIAEKAGLAKSVSLWLASRRWKETGKQRKIEGAIIEVKGDFVRIQKKNPTEAVYKIRQALDEVRELLEAPKVIKTADEVVPTFEKHKEFEKRLNSLYKELQKIIQKINSAERKENKKLLEEAKKLFAEGKLYSAYKKHPRWTEKMVKDLVGVHKLAVLDYSDEWRAALLAEVEYVYDGQWRVYDFYLAGVDDNGEGWNLQVPWPYYEEDEYGEEYAKEAYLGGDELINVWDAEKLVFCGRHRWPGGPLDPKLRQGDLLFVKTKKQEPEKLPEAQERLVIRGSHQILGKIHILEDTERSHYHLYTIYVPKGAVVKHTSHNQINLEPGIYEIWAVDAAD